MRPASGAAGPRWWCAHPVRFGLAAAVVLGVLAAAGRGAAHRLRGRRVTAGQADDLPVLRPASGGFGPGFTGRCRSSPSPEPRPTRAALKAVGDALTAARASRPSPRPASTTQARSRRHDRDSHDLAAGCPRRGSSSIGCVRRSCGGLGPGADGLLAGATAMIWTSRAAPTTALPLFLGAVIGLSS